MTTKKSIKKTIYDKIQLKAIGNSEITMKDLAIDVINARIAEGQSSKSVAETCHLNHKTIVNLIEGKTKLPQGDTLERVFRSSNMELILKPTKIQAKFANKPKSKRK